MIVPAKSIVRDEYFDFIRGIFIIFVVSIHASIYGVPYLDRGINDPNFLFTLLTRQALICAVPVFVMLAGYFSPAARQRDELFTARRISRILVPYIAWCAIIVVAMRMPPMDAAVSVLTGTVLGPHYFVPVILALVVAERFIPRRYVEHRWFLPACLSCTALHIAVAYVVHILYPEVSWWYFMALPTAWVGYYGLGIHLRLHPPKLGYWPLVAVAGLALSFLEAYYLTATLGINSGAMEPVKLSSFVYASAVCVVVIALKGAQARNGFLVWLGAASYGIFLSHELFRGRVYKMLINVAPGLDAVQPLMQVLVMAITLLIACGVAKAAQMILGSKRSAAWLGF